ncbi:MAG: aminoacyl-histidine dipeptidase [Cellulosilyticaceae bacterium]
MTEVLKDLKPQDMFGYFEQISNIPRGSGNEKAISDYMVAFAKERGLWVMQDEVNNVYIKKPATAGYEGLPTVIIQGHLDMVCEKNKDTQHDFETEGLKLKIDGDFIRAEGTTLGADNGIAIAYQMAILADQTLEHPAIEVLMTTAEETGMFGVAGMHPEYLEGKVFLNLDTDIEGEFLVSCAGGARAAITLPITKVPCVDAKQSCYCITINGLLGGHSGADIHRERANANILIGRMLHELSRKVSFNIVQLAGGSKDNVITREAEVIIAIAEQDNNILETALGELLVTYQNEYCTQDPNLNMKWEKTVQQAQCLDQVSTKGVMDLLLALPYGVMGYSMQITGLVETSLNIGVISTDQDVFKITIALRSSMPTKKQWVIDKLCVISERFGAKCDISGQYPAWTYAQNSRIRELASDVYTQMFGMTPKVEAIHAGLECGFILEKLPHLDMIAFGPNVYDIHSPEERASISSMAKIYQFLVQLLKDMKSY